VVRGKKPSQERNDGSHRFSVVLLGAMWVDWRRAHAETQRCREEEKEF